MAQHPSPFVTIGSERYHIPWDSKIYHLPPPLVHKLARFDEDLVPTTVIDWALTDFTPDDLESICGTFAAADDVWSSHFLSREFSGDA